MDAEGDFEDERNSETPALEGENFEREQRGPGVGIALREDGAIEVGLGWNAPPNSYGPVCGLPGTSWPMYRNRPAQDFFFRLFF